MSVGIVSTFESEKLCAVCVKQKAHAWGALCADCEDLVADLTPDEWDRLEQMPAQDAARYILSYRNRERARRLENERSGICNWSDLDLDECPHCTGNFTGFEVECEHGNNAFGCRDCAVQ